MGEAHCWGRATALLALEVRVQWRYGIVALAAVLTAAWTGLLVALPQPTARMVGPWLLMLETAVLGSTLAGALVLLDRGHGVRAAFAVSPARTGEYLGAKLGLLTALVLASAVPVAFAGRVAPAPALLGVGLTAVLTMLIAVAVATRCQSVLGFMVALPLALLPLVAPAVAHGAGLRHPLLYASPVTAAMDLVQGGGYAGVGLGWLVLTALLAAILVARQPRRGPERPTSHGELPLLVLIGVSPVLLGLAARFGYAPVHGWLLRSNEIDLHPYRPLLLAVAVMLHVPVTFGMIGALRALDDVDDRAIVALRVSPLTLPRYLARRAGQVAAATLAGLLVAVPLSGLVPLSPRLAPAVLLAALLAPTLMLATLAVAGNKVEGVAVLKLLGLPLYAPVAAWWLTGPAGWPFAVLPTWWVVRSLWAGELVPALGFAAAGLAVTAAALGLLSRRALAVLRRL